MTQVNKNSPKKQSLRDTDGQVKDKLNIFSSENGLQKLNILVELTQHLSMKENIIKKQYETIKDYQQKVRKQYFDEKRRDRQNVIVEKLKKNFERQKQKLNEQISLLKEKCKHQQETISFYKNDSLKVQKINGQKQSSQIKARLQFEELTLKNKLLQEKNAQLQSKLNNRQDKIVSNFTKRVDDLKADFGKIQQQLSNKLDKQKRLIQTLNKQNTQMKLRYAESNKKLIDSQQKLKISKKINARLFKSYAEIGEKETEFQRRVSIRQNDQLSEDINKQPEEYLTNFTSAIKSIFGNNKTINQENKSLKASLVRAQSKNKELEDSIRECHKKISETQKLLAQVTFERESTDKKLENKNKQIIQLQNSQKILQNQLSLAKKRSSQLSISLRDQQSATKTEAELKQNALKAIKQKDSQISQKNAKINQLDNRIESLEMVQAEKSKQISQLKLLIENKQTRIGQLSSNIAQFNKKIKMLDQQIQSIKSKYEQAQSQNSQLKRINKQLKREIQRLKALLNNSQIMVKSLRQNYQKLKQGFKKLSLTYNQCLIEPITYAFLGERMNIGEPRPDKVDEIQRDLQQVGQYLRTSFRASKYFNNSRVLNEVQVDYLVETIEAFTKRNIQNSLLIYRYDIINPVNFHSYIDKKQNLLLVVKLANGYVIGGFTEYAIDKAKIEKPGSGFIFNCNLKKSYYVKNDARLPVVSYDDYFCLFGNAEIRLKSQEAKIFSNFGIASSTFDTGRESRTKFLNIENSNDNELDLESYEFYQIKLKK